MGLDPFLGLRYLEMGSAPLKPLRAMSSEAVVENSGYEICTEISGVSGIKENGEWG